MPHSALAAPTSPEFLTPPDQLLTHWEEGSYISKGAIIEYQGTGYIVAVWRNRYAQPDVCRSGGLRWVSHPCDTFGHA